MHIALPRYDYLKITNEVNETFGVYCGRRTGRRVTVTGHWVSMKFHSDQSIQKRGFDITLTTTPICKCKRRGRLGEFETVMQTFDYVSALHNFREFYQL